MGWEPEERHEHYDAKGTLTGYTVVTREAEFEDGDLERLLALGQYEAGVCACGYHESLTADKTNIFALEYRVCNLCKGVDQHLRAAAEDAKRWQKQFENQPPAAPRPSDGRRLMVRQLNPLEAQARRAGGGRMNQAARKPVATDPGPTTT